MLSRQDEPELRHPDHPPHAATSEYETSFTNTLADVHPYILEGPLS